MFVDFCNKSETERPDFYILTAEEWHDVVIKVMSQYKEKHPDRRAEIVDGVLVLLDEVNRDGKPYRGCGIGIEHVRQHQEKWEKFQAVVAK